MTKKPRQTQPQTQNSTKTREHQEPTDIQTKINLYKTLIIV